MNLDVGQIIYVLSSETDHIVPMQVCEELRRRSINGEEVTYLIASGPDKQTFKLNEINGKVFVSLELALDHLKKNFDAWLEKQTAWTAQQQHNWYKMEASEKPVQ